MQIPQTNPLAGLPIDQMLAPFVTVVEANKGKLKSIGDRLEGYSVATHSSVLLYIMFRIKNTVLAIFGQSDWQIARKDALSIVNALPLPKVLTDSVDMSDVVDSLFSAIVDFSNVTENGKTVPTTQQLIEIVTDNFSPILGQIKNNCKDETIKKIALLADKLLHIAPQMFKNPLPVMASINKYKQQFVSAIGPQLQNMQDKVRDEMMKEVQATGKMPANEAEATQLAMKFMFKNVFSMLAPVLNVAEQAVNEIETQYKQ